MTSRPPGSCDVVSTDSLYDLVEELTDRLQRGEVVDLSAVIAAHPQHADRLRQVLPALEILAHTQSTTSSCAVPAVLHSIPVEAAHGVLGDFRIVREIGRGGMGVVYEAEQISLDRRVALKVLPFAGVLDARQLQRFKNEARAAAGLHHPHIVPVYGVGCERGVHFYAMQYIEGQTLAAVAQQWRAARTTNGDGQMPNESRSQNSKRRIPPSTRQLFDSSTRSAPSKSRFRTIADWGIQVAEALDYAHTVGVIHRDIKPANLMLDTLGRVWITDFGLAQIETDAGLTMTGDILGTLRYMSPEQALGERGLVDQRTDVYSLGAALYELLTLEPVFGNARRSELLRRITTDDPLPLRRIDREIPAELETIVLKALDKDPPARYATARGLADDLRRFREEQPIKARQATYLDRLRKWSRRNRGLVRTSLAFAIVAAISSVVAWLVVDHERQQTRFEQQARAADQKIAEAAQEDLRIHRYVTNINLAERAWYAEQFGEARRHLQDCLPGEGEQDLRSFEWHYLWRATQEVPPLFVGHKGDVYCVRPSPDGLTLATAGQDGVRIWDYATGRQLASLTAHEKDVNGVAYSPDGTLLATAGDDHTAKIWETTDWRVVHTIPHAGEVVGAAFTPDSSLLATAERHYYGASGERIGEDVVRLWDVASWDTRGELRGHSFWTQSLCISDDGTLLASGSTDGTACLWELATGALRQRVSHRSVADSAAGVQSVSIAHRRPLLATAGSDGTVNLWRTSDGAHEARLTASGHPLEGVAFAPDDSSLVAVGHDHSLYIWETTQDGRYVSHRILRSLNRLWSAAFVDPTTIITGEAGGLVRRWDGLRTPDRYRVPRLASPLPNFAFSPDSQSLVTAAGDLRLINLASQTEVAQPAPPSARILSAAYSPDGKSAVSGDFSGRVTIRDAISWDPQGTLLSLAGPVTDLKYIGDGRKLAAQVASVRFQIVDAVTGGLLASPISAVNPPDAEEFACNCDIAAGLRTMGTMELWSDGKKVWQTPGPMNGPAPAITADCRRIARGFDDGTIHIWNTAHGESEFIFVGDAEATYRLAFSPDGRTLAGVTTGNTLKLWNVATGRELLALGTSLTGTFRLSFSPDGRALAVSGSGISGLGEVIVWQAAGPK